MPDFPLVLGGCAVLGVLGWLANELGGLAWFLTSCLISIPLWMTAYAMVHQ